MSFDELGEAMSELERETPLRLISGRDLSKLVQGNVYSGIVSNLLTAILKETGKNIEQPINDRSWPDLRTGKDNEPLELKASTDPWKGGEGHNGHGGWTLVAGYHLMQDGRVLFSTVKVANLLPEDWKYLGSTVKAETGTQRTETYITTKIGTARLRDGLAYWDSELAPLSPAMIASRRRVELEIPGYSPFAGAGRDE
jgi:hypothetical protein